MTDLFVGVVSHRASRFPESRGANGLAEQLARSARLAGIETVVKVNIDDAYDASALPIDALVVQRSLDEQMRLADTWADYLHGPRHRSRWVHRILRRLRRLEQRVHPPGSVMVERLLNIELSHLDLLRAGAASGASWVLILEDDAASGDVVDCAEGLLGLAADVVDREQPAYVNVSRSFTNAQLGIESLVTRVESATWAGTTSRALLSASRPVTNTVCAILYRSSFVPVLLDAMDRVPMEPVVPIDWKLNAALMILVEEGILGAGDCWLVDPGPIDQLSMLPRSSS